MEVQAQEGRDLSSTNSNTSTMSGDDSDCDIEDDDYENYYNSQIEDELDMGDVRKDPESFQYECLRVEEVEKLLNELVEMMSIKLNVSYFHC